ncbi:SRPBCC domain-containing protein [Pseudophaeobacter sp. 1A16562]|uniref:SRPBCC family protein n=1 Tax=unclassified Pseudophaeobacter TaxID=2637024 RepID=UPI0034D6983D
MLKPIIASLSITSAALPLQADTTKSLTRLEINTSIDIPAPADVIWDILADTDAYPEWNPYHVRVEGEMKIGQNLAVHVEKPNGTAVTVNPRLMEYDRGKSLVWGGGPVGIFRGVHRFDLESLSPTCARLHHTEVFSGLFISFAELDAIEPGYVLMNEALKERVAALRDNGNGC